jgi:hypothetical protein
MKVKIFAGAVEYASPREGRVGYERGDQIGPDLEMPILPQGNIYINKRWHTTWKIRTKIDVTGGPWFEIMLGEPLIPGGHTVDPW